jgi:hypothetical protein
VFINRAAPPIRPPKVSRFTTCGSWEGHYILDFLKENESDVRPDTIHADRLTRLRVWASAETG